ncbi:hypothetical protein C8R45DRAFT_937723 [Mycena sanguinolenta]|nr:hypothetical protein C8R45DRAFT_937723 [Mycena sanguinolenta]
MSKLKIDWVDRQPEAEQPSFLERGKQLGSRFIVNRGRELQTEVALGMRNLGSMSTRGPAPAAQRVRVRRVRMLGTLPHRIIILAVAFVETRLLCLDDSDGDSASEEGLRSHLLCPLLRPRAHVPSYSLLRVPITGASKMRLSSVLIQIVVTGLGGSGRNRSQQRRGSGKGVSVEVEVEFDHKCRSTSTRLGPGAEAEGDTDARCGGEGRWTAPGAKQVERRTDGGRCGWQQVTVYKGSVEVGKMGVAKTTRVGEFAASGARAVGGELLEVGLAYAESWALHGVRATRVHRYGTSWGSARTENPVVSLTDPSSTCKWAQVGLALWCTGIRIHPNTIILIVIVFVYPPCVFGFEASNTEKEKDKKLRRNSGPAGPGGLGQASDCDQNQRQKTRARSRKCVAPLRTWVAAATPVSAISKNVRNLTLTPGTISGV